MSDLPRTRATGMCAYRGHVLTCTKRNVAGSEDLHNTRQQYQPLSHIHEPSILESCGSHLRWPHPSKAALVRQIRRDEKAGMIEDGRAQRPVRTKPICTHTDNSTLAHMHTRMGSSAGRHIAHSTDRARHPVKMSQLGIPQAFDPARNRGVLYGTNAVTNSIRVLNFIAASHGVGMHQQPCLICLFTSCQVSHA